jgi:enoyl-CoA hydratase/carnithine racemase
MARAAEMSFTGEAIDAKTALDWGMVSRVVPAADLLTTAQTLARKMAVNSPPAVRMTKRLLREGQTASLANLLELSAAYQAIAHKTPEHAKIVNDFMTAKAARQAARK